MFELDQLPRELRLPTDHEDLGLSLLFDLTHVSSPFLQSPLSSSITSCSKLIFSTNHFRRFVYVKVYVKPDVDAM